MEPSRSDRRREPRFPIVAEASVEVHNNGRLAKATTLDISGCGVLLEFNEPPQLVAGDQVACEFNVSYEAEAANTLPYWGMGEVVRVRGSRVAVELTVGGFSPADLGVESPAPGEPV
jgi:hypothetical protein